MPVEITAAAVAEVVKRVVQLASGLKNADLLREIREMKRLAAELDGECVDLLTENAALKRKLEARESPPTRRDKKGRVWFGPDQDDGPYCSACWDVRQEKVGIVTSPTYKVEAECPNPACRYQIKRH